jgi:hypothetical protein
MSVHIVKIPGELAEELDRVAGHRRRSAYAIEVLWNDVRRRKQRQALQFSAGAWKDHPELRRGGGAYVEQIRSEPDERFESALARRSP